MNDPMLTRSRERHSAAVERREQIVESARVERRDNLSEEEDREFRRLTDEIRDYKDRIAELTSQQARVTVANSAYARANGGRDNVSYVYTREGRQVILRTLSPWPAVSLTPRRASGSSCTSRSSAT